MVAMVAMCPGVSARAHLRCQARSSVLAPHHAASWHLRRPAPARHALSRRRRREDEASNPRLVARTTVEGVLATEEAPPAAAPAPEAEGPAPINYKDYWWPCVFLSDLDKKTPYPFTLLGEPIVIWCDKQGQWQAFRDACPHRLIPLSEGRITPEGQLECGYHGWRFEAGGRCTAIPQGGDPASPRACATAYQCVVKQGLVWVKLQPAPADGSAPSADGIPVIPELDDEAWVGFGDMWRDLPYDYATLLENVLDAGHVPFTHHGTVSKRQSSGVYDDMRISEKLGPNGFAGLWPTGPRRGGLGAQSTLFQAPQLMRHTIDAFDTRGFANITSVYAVPTTPGRCRAFVRQPFKFKNRLLPKLLNLAPAFLGHLGNLNVLDDDVVFLHLQEAEAVKRGLAEQPIGKVYYMPGASDAYVSGFRSWLQRYAGGGPFGPQTEQWLQEAGPRLAAEQLLDHYHSHVEKCEICRTALKRVRVLRVVGAVGAVVAGLAAAACAGVWWAVTQLPSFSGLVPPAGVPLLRHGAVVSGLAAFALGMLWNWCQKTIPRFYTGKLPAARNTVPGEWAP